MKLRVSRVWSTFLGWVGVDDKYQSRALRCFRASEALHRMQEYEHLKDKHKDLQLIMPHNPLQHTNIVTTEKHYASQLS